ncbi:MAG TPA: PEP-CTERM sorting domain-containing protein [Thiobacillaceae bacterium]|nr:PEP-CTERM sorting domain-containing protein [Thiobacillaceae bacterium]
MHNISHRFAAAILTLAALAGPAQAGAYVFSQGGFTGGGSLTGNFTGTDLNLDGWLDASLGEVSRFALSFAGDSRVGGFSMGFAELAGLLFNMNGGGFIGDEGAIGTGEGIAALSAERLYLTGIGPAGSAGGNITDITSLSGATTETSQPVAVSAVPEPETWAVLLAGLGLVTLRLRRRV